MSYGGYDPNRVPVYLEASSKNKLVEMMFVTQEINSTNFNYQTPMKDGSKWVVWFYIDSTRHELISEKDLNKTSSIAGMIKGVDSRGVN